MGSLKLEESGLVEMDSGKEELDHIASFSDLETDDETCWFQDSQVEDDDANEKVIDTMLTTFIPACKEVFNSATR